MGALEAGSLYPLFLPLLAKAKGVKLIFPVDYICADKFDPNANTQPATINANAGSSGDGGQVASLDVRHLLPVVLDHILRIPAAAERIEEQSVEHPVPLACRERVRLAGRSRGLRAQVQRDAGPAAGASGAGAGASA